MALILMLPGSPLPDWLVFLAPVVAVLLIVQGVQWLYHKWVDHQLSKAVSATPHTDTENSAEQEPPLM